MAPGLSEPAFFAYLATAASATALICGSPLVDLLGVAAAVAIGMLLQVILRLLEPAMPAPWCAIDADGWPVYLGHLSMVVEAAVIPSTFVLGLMPFAQPWSAEWMLGLDDDGGGTGLNYTRGLFLLMLANWAKDVLPVTPATVWDALYWHHFGSMTVGILVVLVAGAAFPAGALVAVAFEVGSGLRTGRVALGEFGRRPWMVVFQAVVMSVGNVVGVGMVWLPMHGLWPRCPRSLTLFIVLMVTIVGIARNHTLCEEAAADLLPRQTPPAYTSFVADAVFLGICHLAASWYAGVLLGGRPFWLMSFLAVGPDSSEAHPVSNPVRALSPTPAAAAVVALAALVLAAGMWSRRRSAARERRCEDERSLAAGSVILCQAAYGTEG